MSAAALGHVMRETIRRNRVRNGLVYLQVTRGGGPREFNFPGSDVPPHGRLPRAPASRRRAGVRGGSGHRRQVVARHPLAPLRNQDGDAAAGLLAKEAAKRDGAREAWFVDDKGFVTEGASSNAWIVTHDGTVITRQIDPAILAGVTRATLMDVLKQERIELQQRPFHIEEALQAREAFITSATNTVMPVVRIDGTGGRGWKTGADQPPAALEISPVC